LSADVSHSHKYASVTARLPPGTNHCETDAADEWQASLQETAIASIDAVGFDASPIDEIDSMSYTVHLRVEGMMCQKNCGSTVEAALNGLLGVVSAQASFPKSYATVTATLEHYGPGSLMKRIERLQNDAVEAVECVGFDASLLSSEALIDYLETQQHQETDSNTSTLSDNENEFLLVDEPIVLDGNTASFSVKGMSCAVCVGRVINMLQQVQGVSHATVALTTHRAQIQIKSGDIREIADSCAKVVTKGGYDCTVLQAGANGRGVSLAENAAQLEESRQHELNTWRSLLITSVVLSVPLVILHHHDFACLHNMGVPFCQETIELVLATLVQIIVGKRYYKAAWKGWVNGRFLGMDFLVVMGTTAAYVFSVITYITHVIAHDDTGMKDAAFETGAMLFTFVTLGKFLESYAKGKTASALQMLMELQPNMALKVTNMGSMLEGHLDVASLQTEAISANDVRVGDYLYVLPGSRIPADGIFIASSDTAAHAYVDESALSGEPFPVAKPIGSQVFGATINQLTTLVVRVTASGSSTVLAKIVQLMEQAQSQKAPIEAQADKVACIFAPTVMTLSLFTLLGWIFLYDHNDRWYLGIMSAISVIVVACPCALGLATPTAVMVGTGVGARHGLLIKGGAVLESAHSVDTVIFDKTGTLTTSKAVVRDNVQFLSDDDDIVRGRPAMIRQDQVCLWLAACAEKQSEHPLAKAIVNAAKGAWGADVTCSSEGVQVDAFLVVPGSGVECIVRGPSFSEWRIRVGNKDWTTEALNATDNVDAACDGEKELIEIRRQGKVGVYVSIIAEEQYVLKHDISGKPYRRRIAGVIGIADPVQAEAKSTVAALKLMGVDVWMCTGDDETTACAVAREVGISEENVCAGVKPEGKADLVTRLQKKDRVNPPRRDKRRSRHQQGRVGFVGDGINDAIALARADVGIAIGAGTEVAVEAADIVLVRSSLHDVVVALHLSRVVFRRIRLNFVWAMAYNLMALPFAAGVFYVFTNFRLPPQFAGLMMAFSSVSVVTSSLLLRTYSKPCIRADGTFERKQFCLPTKCRSPLVVQKIALPRNGPVYSDLGSSSYDDESLNTSLELV
jgi:P-type Cu+ transporter